MSTHKSWRAKKCMSYLTCALLLAVTFGCATTQPTVDWQDVRLQEQLIRTGAMTAILVADDAELATELLPVAEEAIVALSVAGTDVSDVLIAALKGKLDEKDLLILEEALHTLEVLYEDTSIEGFIGEDNIRRVLAFWEGIRVGCKIVLADGE